MNSLEYGTLTFIAPNGEVSVHQGRKSGAFGALSYP